MQTFPLESGEVRFVCAGLQSGQLSAAPGLPGNIKHWSLRTLLVRLIKIGAKVLRQSRYVIFQMAEVAISKGVFSEILSGISRLRCCSLQ